MKLETERLLLREFDGSDAAVFHVLGSDAAIGLAGLKCLADMSEVDIGYLLRTKSGGY